MPESWLNDATMTASRIGLRYFRWKNGSCAETVSSCSDVGDFRTSASGSSLPMAPQHVDRLVAAVLLDQPARALRDAQQEHEESAAGTAAMPSIQRHAVGRRPAQRSSR